ncbi:MAG: SDR family oxidoreductase [Rhodobacteraceae bacterium]|nr:MAG: SDR family oxidoreductase [Paracoccaceae bacterium]
MTQTNDKKIALVTGASRGLGAAMAETLGSTGWHVVALGRTMGALEELDDRIKAKGGTATLAAMDITKDDAIRHLCRDIHDRWGHLDLWVHTAIHAPPMSPADHIALKDWDKCTAINIRATGVLIPMIAPLLTAAPSRATALFINDAAARGKFMGAYGASKAAQIALAQAWQLETARIGARVMIEEARPMPTATRARFYPGENRDTLTPCLQEAERLLRALAD